MNRISLKSPGSIPNHKLQKNLQLNGKYLSNDGGDEGIQISNIGNTVVTGRLYFGSDGSSTYMGGGGICVYLD